MNNSIYDIGAKTTELNPSQEKYDSFDDRDNDNELSSTGMSADSFDKPRNRKSKGSDQSNFGASLSGDEDEDGESDGIHIFNNIIIII